jgi:excisionase family DNA binding protein
MAQQEYLTVEEVAALLRVSEATVRGLISRGELRAMMVGKQYRISREALQEYERKHSYQ